MNKIIMALPKGRILNELMPLLQKAEIVPEEEFNQLVLYNFEKFTKLAFLANSCVFGHQVSQILVINDLAQFGL